MIRSVPWKWAGLRWGILACMVAAAPASQAFGQGFGPDPFNPYNSRYEPFVYPVAPGPLDYGFNQGFSGAARGGVRGANQFEDYMENLRGGPNARPRGGTNGGAGTPYYRSDRTFDREFDRTYQYRPNRLADEKFETNQEEVSRLYFRYLREKDPKRRAEIFREYNRARNLADRDLSGSATSRTRGTPKSGRRETPAPGPGAAAGSGRGGPAPPVVGESSPRTRRSRAGASGARSSVGPPPSPLDDSAAPRDVGGEASPSRVLERALRTDPAGRSTRTRRPAAPGLGPPPPP